MPNNITALTVGGIFGKQNIKFDFRKRPFFIVGPNGTGKSTALKILHSVLTAQWSDLNNYNFEYVDIDYDDGAGVILDKSDFPAIQRIKQAIARSTRRLRNKDVYPDTWEAALALMAGPQTVTGHSRTLSDNDIEEIEVLYTTVAPLLNLINRTTVGKVLYFPTYRRVERDIGELLHAEEAIEAKSEFAPQIATRFEASGEVVGFGGQDITALLAQSAREIDSAARKALNDHSVRFLESLSRNEPYDTTPAEKLIVSNEDTISFLNRLARFGGSNFQSVDVNNAIDQLRSIFAGDKGSLSSSQQMMLLYITELITLFDDLSDLLLPLERFASLLTIYFKPTKFVSLNKIDYSIEIYESTGYPLSIDQLSSGEKQIVAFLAFLLLKSRSPRFIIIDEPELSLSVTWQLRLIRDMAELAPQAYVVAATHSPFVFERFDPANVESLGVL